MPRVFKGTIKQKGSTSEIVCILDKDIKINIYEPVAQGLESMLNQMGSQFSKALTNEKKLLGSYVSYIEKDTDTKGFKRRTFLYGDLDKAYVVLEHTAHSYLEQEEIGHDSYPDIEGMMEVVNYSKKTTNFEVSQSNTLLNGILKIMEIEVTYTDNQKIEIRLEEAGTGRVTLTKGLKYRESLFDIGDIRENAIHSQVRSLQHLRTVKDLDWIEDKIQRNLFRIVETKEDIELLIREIQSDLKETGEKKIYWDTEGTGLNVMDLPPDHPNKDMMAAHVISWVKERRPEDGYPLKVVSVTIPVGMRYTQNVNEIETAEMLRPILCNPEIGVVAHNTDYELQIGARYNEYEGELSYNEYHKWIESMGNEDVTIDEDYYKQQIVEIETEVSKIEADESIPMILKRSRLSPHLKKLQEYKNALNFKNEIEKVKALPKEEKPYLSKVKGERLYDINMKYDTLILSRMVNNGGHDKNGIPFFRHNLEFLSKNYLDIDQLSLDDIYGNSSSSKYKIYDFSLLPREFMLYYACPDGYNLPFIEWHLEQQAYKHMIELGHKHDLAYRANLELLNLYYHVDMPFSAVQSKYGNYKGIGIDKEILDLERKEQEDIRESLLTLLQDLTGETDMSWTSGKQVGSLMFYKYKYPVKYRTDKENLPSYNKMTRKLHSNQFKNKHDAEYANCVPIRDMEEDLIVGGEVIVDKDKVNAMQCPLSYIYQLFMDRHKDLTSFTQMIYDRTYEVNGEWIFYPNYTSTSTDTGRASGGIMIMKAAKKGLFIARNDHVLAGGDLDAAELRLIATMAQDLEEIERFKDPRYDPHTKTASDVNKVEMTEVTGLMRNAAKTINFGIAYGIGPEAATRNIYPNIVPLPDNLIAQTRMMMKEYNRAYLSRSTWLNNLRADTVKYGFSKTPMGRYKFFPETQNEDTENWELARAGRQGGNVPIQGLCADYIKQRIVKVFNQIEEAGITRFFTMPIFVHDEFFMEVNKYGFKNAENKLYTNQDVKDKQEFNLMWLYSLMYKEFTEIPLGLNGIENEAPMTMGIGIGASWGDAKSDLYGCPQELQKDLVVKYRKGELTDEFHNSISNEPIETMLHEIRSWWATQVKVELEKSNVNLKELPNNIEEYVDSLFLKRNLKDIFSINGEELEEMGLEPNQYFLGQCIKALKYLNGEQVQIIDITEQDKTKGIEDIVYSEEESYTDNVTSLQEYKNLKKFYRTMGDKVITDYDRENIESAYASVFKESSMMRYNRYMAFEETRSYEFNIKYLSRNNIVELEKLIRKYDGLGNYKVVIISRADGSIWGDTKETTYQLPVSMEFLEEVQNLYLKNDHYMKEKEKELASNIK